MSKKLCPSFTADPGAFLLGRVVSGGTVAVLRSPLRVTEAFLAGLRARRIEPEAAFRFAGPCHQSACTRWANGGCQLIEQLAAGRAVSPPGGELPACGIRDTCRWYFQRGGPACQVCARVTRASANSV